VPTATRKRTRTNTNNRQNSKTRPSSKALSAKSSTMPTARASTNSSTTWSSHPPAQQKAILPATHARKTSNSRISARSSVTSRPTPNPSRPRDSQECPTMHTASLPQPSTPCATQAPDPRGEAGASDHDPLEFQLFLGESPVGQFQPRAVDVEESEPGDVDGICLQLLPAGKLPLPASTGAA
jgi:hypothetical protein